jgi:hypothetical protein
LLPALSVVGDKESWDSFWISSKKFPEQETQLSSNVSLYCSNSRDFITHLILSLQGGLQIAPSDL